MKDCSFYCGVTHQHLHLHSHDPSLQMLKSRLGLNTAVFQKDVKEITLELDNNVLTVSIILQVRYVRFWKKSETEKCVCTKNLFFSLHLISNTA